MTAHAPTNGASAPMSTIAIDGVQLPATWDEPPFDAAEYRDRLERTRRAMQSLDIELLVVTSPDNLYYLTGYESAGYYQLQAAIVPADDTDVTLLVHEVEAGVVRASSWVDDVVYWQHAGGNAEARGPGDPTAALIERLLSAKPRSIGLELTSMSLPPASATRIAEALPTARVLDTTRLVPEIRAIKSPREIGYLRAAAQLSDLGVEVARREAVVGASEASVAAAIEWEMKRRGSEYACMPTMLLSGERTVRVHQAAATRTIGDNDVVTVEIAGVVRRYNSNILRSFVPSGGPGPRDFEAAYDLICEAFTACVEMMGPGVAGADVDATSRRVTRRFDRYRLHRTGYGLECGYPPAWMGAVSLAETDPLVLQPGMVVSVEPTLIFYDRVGRDAFSALVGSNVLVTEHGCEVLNQVPMRL